MRIGSKTVRQARGTARTAGMAAALALAVGATIMAGGAGTAQAAFLPVIDEFWIERNGGEIFRDSFNNGVLPQFETTGPNPTYATGGEAGFILESSGKLTMNPALGIGTLIPGAPADLFTGAIRRTSIAGGGNELNQASSFAVHGLFDLSSLPGAPGDTFGIRLTDRVAGVSAGTDDTISLSVRYHPVNGFSVDVLHIDAINDIVTVLDTGNLFIESGRTATTIEMYLAKDSGVDTLQAGFTVFDQFGDFFYSDTLFVGTTELITIFNGEDFTRAQFFATTSVDVPEVAEPGALAVLGLGLAALGALRRRRQG